MKATLNSILSCQSKKSKLQKDGILTFKIINLKKISCERQHTYFRLEIVPYHPLAPSTMGLHGEPQFAIRYRGFILLRQPNLSWLVRPERSPMELLPFRTPVCSIEEVKSLVDCRLTDQKSINAAA